jgi:hypothetical protein
MNANETLAKYYDPTRRQLIGVDGEFWRHNAGGNWEWVCKFTSEPSIFAVRAFIGNWMPHELFGLTGVYVCE